jgi:hypothetical protein
LAEEVLLPSGWHPPMRVPQTLERRDLTGHPWALTRKRAPDGAVLLERPAREVLTDGY